jgi:hypothetical protein
VTLLYRALSYAGSEMDEVVMDMELIAHDKSLAANRIIPRSYSLSTTSSYSCILRRTVTAAPSSLHLSSTLSISLTPARAHLPAQSDWIGRCLKSPRQAPPHAIRHTHLALSCLPRRCTLLLPNTVVVLLDLHHIQLPPLPLSIHLLLIALAPPTPTAVHHLRTDRAEHLTFLPSLLALRPMARGDIQKPKLTKGAKTANQPSTDPYHSDTFDFPTLNNDGSVSDLIETHPPPGQRTPPAALSSLGLKMAADSNPDAVTELNDGQYDMVDDVSEVSNDSNETVSIASDNLTSDDETTMTPEDEDEDEGDSSRFGLFDSNNPSSAGPSAGPLHQQLLMLDQQHRQKLRQTRERAKLLQKEYESEKERTLDSFLSEDLETPRQSTMNAFDPSSSTHTISNRSSNTKSSPTVAADKRSSSNTQASPAGSTSQVVGRFLMSGVRVYLNILIMVALLAGLQFAAKSYLSSRPASLDVRRDALSGALVKLTNSTNATKSFNIDHLLPVPTTLPSTNIFGQPEQGTLEVHFQGAQPNYIIVSLPNKAGKTPQIASTAVYKGDKPIAFNQSKLIDGIYAITLDPQDAYGIVTVAMPCKKPDLNITVSHNFGRRYLQVSDLEKAISEVVVRDVEAARRITSKLTAGLAATHNVSTQLAQQVGHEAQAMANKATSMAEKWYSACGATVAATRKDIIAVQEGFARVETQVDEYVADVAGRVKRSVMEPLAVAQDRAGRIRAKYFGSEAAREQVCKRNVPSKDVAFPGTAVVREGVKGKQQSCQIHKKTIKDGALVEMKTCGSCDGTKKCLGPKGLTKNKN